MGDCVANRHRNSGHSPGNGRRHIHRRFIRFQRDDRIVDCYFITGADVDFDDRYVTEVTDVGNSYLLDAHVVLLSSADGCIGDAGLNNSPI